MKFEYDEKDERYTTPDELEYFSWFAYEAEAQLDGHFTAAQLREIAAHMEKNKKP